MKKRAFTLLEVLIVIAIIAILAAIVIFAIKPGRQLEQAHNARRHSDLNAINKAVKGYYIDNQNWPPSGTNLPNGLTEICDGTGAGPVGCIDLSDLVPVYLKAIPTDPEHIGSGTNYYIALNNNQIQLTAPSSTGHGLDLVAIGTTTHDGLNTVSDDSEWCDSEWGISMPYDENICFQKVTDSSIKKWADDPGDDLGPAGNYCAELSLGDRTWVNISVDQMIELRQYLSDQIGIYLPKFDSPLPNLGSLLNSDYGFVNLVDDIYFIKHGDDWTHVSVINLSTGYIQTLGSGVFTATGRVFCVTQE